MKPDLLIFTNGRETTWPAVEYGAWLGASTRTPATLVGIDEEPSPAQIDEERHPLEGVFTGAIQVFHKNNAEYRLEVLKGHAEEVIPRFVRGRDALTIVAPLGRPPLQRLLHGRSFRHIMAEVSGPILYVPQARLPLKKAVICLGGLGYEVTAENLAVQMAALAGAELVLLTVVPPINLDYPAAREVREHWQNLEATDTPAGRGLRQGLEIARRAGLQASVRVRNGHVVEEILRELQEGNYDLVCMGSPYSANPLRQLYSPNVTAEVAEAAHCPVLTARRETETVSLV
ncbi:MAG: universal stress protein [Chloroflexota bacterium]